MAQLEPKKEPDVKQCLYVDWYKFRQCTVETCKNFSTRTEHRCLAVDRVQPTGTKIISDSEIHYYKFDRDNISTKYVSLRRKEATLRVRSILVLRSLLEYIHDKYGTHPKEEYKTKLLQKRERVYPLKIKQLKFENWMWPYLFSKKVYTKFIKGKSGDLQELGRHDLLAVDPKTFQQLSTLVKEIRNVNKTSDPDNKPSRAGQVKFRVGAKHLKPKRKLTLHRSERHGQQHHGIDPGHLDSLRPDDQGNQAVAAE